MTQAAIAPVVRYAPVARPSHFRTFLIIATCVAASGLAAHLTGGTTPHSTPSDGVASQGSRPIIFAIYLVPALMDFLLVFFIWRGLRRNGGSIADLVGGTWRIWDVLRDLLIAACFWLASAFAIMGLASVLGRMGGASSDASAFMATLVVLSPHDPLEAAAWLFTSMTAGFCEEVAFRGYVLRQLQAMSQSTLAAVLGQAVIFGLMHAYQGLPGVGAATSLGLLYGVLAVWRRSLRPGIIAHAWQDVWGGWLALAFMR